jgi:RNA polymerase sigma factor (sigma-70 family)
VDYVVVNGAEAPAVTPTESFDAFVRAHSSSLLKLALLTSGNYDDGRDAVQEALAALYPRWDRLPSGEELARYVNRAVVNACLKQFRDRRRSVVPQVGWLSTGRESHDTADAVALARDAWSLCAELQPIQRAAVVLRFYQDLTFAEIGRTLGCPEATARSHVHRALASLKARHTRPGTHHE